MTVTLSKRELEVLTLSAEGKDLKAIAKKLCIAPCTVRTHLTNIYGKMGIIEDNKWSVRLKAIMKALKTGIIDLKILHID